MWHVSEWCELRRDWTLITLAPMHFYGSITIVPCCGRYEERMRFLAMLTLVLVAIPCRAADHTMRASVSAGAGTGWAQRVADGNGMQGLFGNVDGSLVFDAIHGVRFGGQVARFGFLLGDMTIKTFDLAYSVQLDTSTDRKRVSGSFGLVVGPSLAFVECADTVANNQTLLGVRAGAFVDVNLRPSPLTLGLDASFRAGTQVAGYPSADWLLTIGIHAGFTFELPLSISHGPHT